MWSLGVVLFIALGGYAPFDGKNEREVRPQLVALHAHVSLHAPNSLRLCRSPAGKALLFSKRFIGFLSQKSFSL